MKFEPEVIKYLKGDLFQTTLTVNIGKTKHNIISREATITDAIKNKSVIHIGCSDHIQIINQKIKTQLLAS